MGWLHEVERALADAPVRRVVQSAGLQRAAVLVPLFVRGGSLWVLLTRRSESLRHHPGAIAFPGGGAQDGDEDEVATALREAEEELGIEAGRAIVLGQLSDAVTATGFVISPVVAAIPEPVGLAPTTAEVVELLPVPVAALASPTLVEEQEAIVGGEAVLSPVLHYGPHCVSGATAVIVLDLLARLSASGRAAAGPRPRA